VAEAGGAAWRRSGSVGMGLARSRGRARVGLASVVVSRRVNGPNPGNFCRVTSNRTTLRDTRTGVSETGRGRAARPRGARGRGRGVLPSPRAPFCLFERHCFEKTCARRRRRRANVKSRAWREQRRALRHFRPYSRSADNQTEDNHQTAGTSSEHNRPRARGPREDLQHAWAPHSDHVLAGARARLAPIASAPVPAQGPCRACSCP
jgi:hypothetical protein